MPAALHHIMAFSVHFRNTSRASGTHKSGSWEARTRARWEGVLLLAFFSSLLLSLYGPHLAKLRSPPHRPFVCCVVSLSGCDPEGRLWMRRCSGSTSRLRTLIDSDSDNYSTETARTQRPDYLFRLGISLSTLLASCFSAGGIHHSRLFGSAARLVESLPSVVVTLC